MKKICNLKIWSITLLIMLFATVAYANSDAGKFIVLGKTIFNHRNVYLAKLKNGKVLIADFDIPPKNGQMKISEQDRYLKKFELYNPKTKTFESMAQPIYWHSNNQPIVLDDGRVLIVGGFCVNMWNKKYVTQFHVDTCEQSQYAELYDPEKNEFKLAGKMNIPRCGFGITKLPDGRVLITNGKHTLPAEYDSEGREDYYYSLKKYGIEGHAEIFDPKTETFSLAGVSSVNIMKKATNPKAEKPLYRRGNVDGQAITLDNGEVLVLWANEGMAEIYDSKTEKFHTVGRMIMKRQYYNVLKLDDGRVLILKGICSAEPSDFAEIYNPTTETFSNLGSLAVFHGRAGISMGLLKNGKVLILGGTTDNNKFPPKEIAIRSMEIFDPKSNKFKYIGEKKSNNYSGKSVLLDEGNVLFISNCKKYKHTCGELYIPNDK